MIKLYIIFLLNLTFLLNIQSQTYVYKYVPLNSKKWGFTSLSGNVNIEPQFPHCFDFSEDGVAVIYYTNIDYVDLVKLDGQFIVPEIMDFSVQGVMGYGLRGFKNGLLPVRVVNKWGCMNKSGKIVIPVKYKEMSPFDNGYATVKAKNGFFVIDTLGNEIPVTYKNINSCKQFSEGLAPFVCNDGNSGFINTKGEVVIRPQFKGVGYFSSGLAWGRTEKNKIGFIDKVGNWVIEPRFDAVFNFDDESGMAIVKIKDKWFFVDKTGQVISIESTEKVISFSEGLSRGLKDGKYGFLNNKGEWVIQPTLQGARDFKNGFAGAKLNGKWGIINKKGEWIVQPSYSHIGDVIIVN